VKAVLKNPWFIGGLGMLALALFIFFVGPLLGFGDARPLEGLWARLVTIIVIVLVWAGVLLFRQIRARKAAAEISTGIVEAEDAGDDVGARSAEEVATLKARFEEATRLLQKSSGAKNALYELPWYMIIGPPGAGKTTALINSGLRFPLADKFGKNALQGVGGTRNCDWWFTDEAILLDTAGRYTTQDSQSAVDRAAWEGFLDLLKRYRKRRPINGVLVAVSITDFMTMDAAQRREHSRAIRDRIGELDQHFGMRFPVYLLITKCDLVNGFIDFFEDLGAEEREQVWGLTLPLDETGTDTGVAETVDRELEALFARLDERTLTRLEQERDLKRRSQIYSFPRQIYSLKEPIVELVEDVFRGSRFEDSAMLRGVYFSSGTQEGTPIDRVMGAISRTYGLQPQALPSFSAGQGRSYFLTRLLRQVVFAEAGIAGTNQKAERRRAWLQRAAYAAVMLVVGLLIVGWTVSFFGNRSAIDQMAEESEQAAGLLADIPQNRHEPEVTLSALDALRTLALGPSNGFTGLGLDQTEQLTEQARLAYRRALVNQLLPRVMLRLEQQVDQTRQPLDYTYEALKAYLRLGSEKRYDAEEIGAWVTLDWDSRLPREIGTEGYEALTGHLTTLLEERPVELPLPMDENVIRRARDRIKRVPLEERIYARLKTLNVISDIDDFTILNRAGPESLLVFVRDSGRPLSEGIPGFYTKEGFKRIFTDTENYQLVQELSAEQWVLRDEDDLADPQDVAKLLLDLRDIYYREYVTEYQDLIYDVELAPFKDAREAASILNILARPGESPLENLISAIQQETNFSQDAPKSDDDAQEGEDAFSAQRERLQQLLSSRAPRPRIAGRAAPRYTNIIEEQFAEFQKLSGGPGADTSPLEHLLSLLRELADFMMLVASEETADGVPEHVVQRGMATVQKVQLEAERLNQPFLANLLTEAATSVSNIASGGVATNIEAQWKADGLEFCRRAIADRYPVASSGTSEIRLEDFGRFFGYGGTMDKFFEAYLKDKVDTTRRPWRAAANRGVQIAPDAIRQFERADAIKETFFRGDTTPYVGFELIPVSMDPSVTQFTLTIDGQSTQYFHGPRVAQSFDWPGPQGVGEVRMEMAPGNGTPMRTERGPWAWFRVLDDVDMQPGSAPEHFTVVFDLGGRTATYELIARSAYNPFKLDELSAFRCPERLSQ
jgi:type VI secretion system protein ImpL